VLFPEEQAWEGQHFVAQEQQGPKRQVVAEEETLGISPDASLLKWAGQPNLTLGPSGDTCVRTPVTLEASSWEGLFRVDWKATTDSKEDSS
jgi:hypothetical protein